MDAPSSESPPPPLGFGFWAVLLIPIVLGLVGLRVHSSGDWMLGTRFLELAMIAAPVSGVTCAVMVGSRYGSGPGFLAFVGIVLLYGSIAFAGCVSSFKL